MRTRKEIKKELAEMKLAPECDHRSGFMSALEWVLQGYYPENYPVASYSVLSEVRAAIQHEIDRLPPDSDLTQYGSGFKAALTAIQNKISEHFR